MDAVRREGGAQVEKGRKRNGKKERREERKGGEGRGIGRRMRKEKGDEGGRKTEQEGERKRGLKTISTEVFRRTLLTIA